MNESLNTEDAFFEENRAEWLKHYEGKYALVQGRKLVGTFTTFDEAYTEGVKQFGNTPMLIRQIVPTDRLEQAPAMTHGLIRPVHA